MRHNFRLAGLAFVIALVATALFVPGSASARCTSGGASPSEVDMCTPTAKAKLLPNGMTKPYIWGGGHGRWWDRGYDCSGSVSYALHGGEFLESPLPSGPMEHWGLEGEGRWITVYANAGHAYAEIAGYRWDTSGDASGTGPRWHEDLRDNVGYVARHPAGF